MEIDEQKHWTTNTATICNHFGLYFESGPLQVHRFLVYTPREKTVLERSWRMFDSLK